MARKCAYTLAAPAALRLARAVKQLGRSPRHVLFLHENDLAALTLALGQGRVIALAVAQGYKGPSRRWEEEKLKLEFEWRRVWNEAGQPSGPCDNPHL